MRALPDHLPTARFVLASASASAFALAITLAGCGRADAEPEAHAAPPRRLDTTPLPTGARAAPSASGSTAATPGAPAGAAGVAELKLASVGNNMAYDTKSFSVKTGQKVHLSFKNSSDMELLPHNWVLVRPGTEATVAAAGLKAGQEAGFLDGAHENVIAFTPLALKGTTVEATFTAPEPGTYPFICTVPGHYMMMKGTLVVTP